jgi:hypothetical protein
MIVPSEQWWLGARAMATNNDDELRERALARLGTSIKGKYRLDRLLGIGGMAVVFAATHRNGRPVALKMLHPELSLNSEVRTRFLREGHAANAVRHPGAVAVLDDDIADDGAAFLVMELLEGATVEEIWEKHDRRVPLDAVLAIGAQVLDVLAAAHANALVHRDIKPANLFLTTAGEIKVLDFGIARLRDVAASTATQTGLMMGTPAFMAPEQAMAMTAEIGAQSDVWAVGATMFTLASGELVHQAENAQQLVIIAATQPARSFAAAMPNAPPAIVDVIDRATAFKKTDRWPSAGAMREAVRGVATVAFGGLMTPIALADVAEATRESKTVLMAAPIGERRASAPSFDGAAAVATQPMGHTPAGALAYRGAPIAGLATAVPVSSDAALRSGRARKRLSTEIIVAAAVGVVVVLCLMLTAVYLVARRASASAAAASAGTSAAADSAPIASTPALAPIATAVASSDGPDAAVQEISIDQLFASSPAPAAPKVSPAMPPRAAKPAAPKTNCSPPYTIHSQGSKHWKRECLK